ncbi:DUF7793 family protein [Arthrobacter sp. CAL618]|uniref:DUF7793 family protein n=1 Tax=Arthrobacter sp. CAL618 TaxID=1055770 RepID=UPI003FCCB65B
MDDSEANQRFSLLPHSGGYIEVQWDQGVTVSKKDAMELVRSLAKVSPALCLPMLVHLNKMISLSRPALYAFASGLNVSALAIVGPTAVDRAITTYFKEVHEPPYPTQYFEEVISAERWLLDPHRNLSG